MRQWGALDHGTSMNFFGAGLEVALLCKYLASRIHAMSLGRSLSVEQIEELTGPTTFTDFTVSWAVCGCLWNACAALCGRKP